MTAVDRVIAAARAEIGYLEKATNEQLDEKLANPGRNNWTKYARDLDGIGNIYNGKKNGYDWCDVFVDWCFITAFGYVDAMQMLNQSYKGLGAGVKYSAQYHMQAGQFFENDPKPGDQIFFGDEDSWWHTGIVVKAEGGRVYTIEGNTSGYKDVVANGGAVVAKSYPLSHKSIKGYGRPDYSLVEEENEVTQEQFNQMMDVWLKQQGQKQPAEWSKAARDWAESIGLIAGDGQGNMMYCAPVTREQLMQFLYRLENEI